jgi:hypothetical protein
MGVVSILEFDVEACLESSTLGGYPGRCMRSPLVRKFRTRRPARSSNAGGIRKWDSDEMCLYQAMVNMQAGPTVSVLSM